MLYKLLKKSAGIFFNILNLLLKGNLPPLACVCIIIEQEGQYLILERPEGPLVFPGGFMRWHERSEDAAQREGKEETGLDLSIGHSIACYTSPSMGFSSMSTVTVVHTAEIVGGELRSSIEGRPYWVDEVTLRSYLEGHYSIMLDDYQQHRQQLMLTNAS